LSGEDRRLAAIMFTDMVGYTSLTQSDEALALELLEEHRNVVRGIVSRYRGEEIKAIGDGFLLEFRSTLEAVRCALEIQDAIERRNAESAPVKRFQVRIGVHSGDVVEVAGDVYGDTVNLASRIEALAEPGGIVISSQVYEEVHNKIAVQIESLGEYRLKNVEAPVLLYELSSSPRKRPVDRKGTLQQEKRRIAILPFTNIGSDAADDYIADGLAEELISAFSRLPHLKVVARTSAMKYKGARRKSASEIGKELGVGALMEGSIRKHAGKLRVTVQLVDTVQEEYLWSQSYDSGVEDILSVQQDIADKAVEALRPKFEPAEESAAGPRRITSNPEAFLLYLKGRYHLTRYAEAEVRKAAGLFEQAAKLDERFASAYAMSAQCHMFLGFFGFVAPSEGFEKARPLLKRAIEIDDQLDIAHMLMGRLLMDTDWDWSGAEAEFKRAIEISPNSAEAHYRYALLLNNLLRNAEAIAEIKVAEELDPLSVAVSQVAGSILYYAGRNREAIERLERAIEIDPNAAFAHENLGLARCQEGDVDAGVAEIKRAMELDPNNVMFRTDLCYAYAKAGRSGEAREVLALVEADQPGSGSDRVPPMALAGMYASLGETDRAVEWLRKAFEEHSPYLCALKVERWFDGIRTDPRFVAMARSIGLD